MKTSAYRISSTLLLTILWHSLISQNYADSLHNLIKNSKSEKTKIEAIIKLADFVGFSDTDSAITLYKSAQKQAVQHESYKSLEALAIHKQGNIYLGIGDFDMAMKKYREAILIRKEINDLAGLGATYNNMGILFSYKGETDSSLACYNQGLKYRTKVKDKKGIAGSLDNIGMLLTDIGNVDSAMKCYEKSLELYQKLNLQLNIAHTYNRIGIILKDKGDISRAMQYYEKSLEILDKISEKKHKANVFANIGLLYNIQDDKEKALRYYHKSLAILREIDDTRRISYLLHNIGAILYKSGIKKQESGNHSMADSLYEEALKYYRESLEIKEKTGNKPGIAISLLNIGNVYIERSRNTVFSKSEKQKFTDIALNHLEKSLQMHHELGHKKNIAFSCISIARIWRMQGKYKQALDYANKAYEISKKLGYIESIKEASDVLEKTYFEMGNYKLAYNFHIEKIAMRDSLEKEEDYKLMQQRYYQFEYEKQAAADSVAHANQMAIKNLEKEKNMEEIRKQKIILFASILGFLVVSGFSVVILRMFRQKKKANIQLNKQNIQILEQKRELSLEKQKSDSLLLNILPFETAEELKAKGKATPRYYESVSVLFTDFKGFSSACAGLTPNEVVEELQMYFEKFDEITYKFGLEKIKTIGDAYMCAGGLPVKNSDHSVKTVQAGLEMQKFMQKLKQDRLQKQDKYWELRIGIHTGEIISGVVGKKKFAYDIWGNTVNIASRMETACDPGKVNISDATFKLVKNHFNCEYRGKIEAKNVGAVDMYFINF